MTCQPYSLQIHLRLPHLLHQERKGPGQNPTRVYSGAEYTISLSRHYLDFRSITYRKKYPGLLEHPCYTDLHGTNVSKTSGYYS
jgi:hypothetical protein